MIRKTPLHLILTSVVVLSGLFSFCQAGGDTTTTKKKATTKGKPAQQRKAPKAQPIATELFEEEEKPKSKQIKHIVERQVERERGSETSSNTQKKLLELNELLSVENRILHAEKKQIKDALNRFIKSLRAMANILGTQRAHLLRSAQEQEVLSKNLAKIIADISALLGSESGSSQEDSGPMTGE